MPLHIRTVATAPGAFDRLTIRNTATEPGAVTVHDAADIDNLGAPLHSFTLAPGADATVTVSPAQPFAHGLTIVADVEFAGSAGIRRVGTWNPETYVPRTMAGPVWTTAVTVDPSALPPTP